MRVVVVGLGVRGGKRLAAAASEVVPTVDPIDCQTRYRDVVEVPLDDYDAALEYAHFRRTRCARSDRGNFDNDLVLSGILDGLAWAALASLDS